MLFSVVVALMVILIAAFWAYQGFFSSIIMFFECVMALMLAFGFYEQINGLWAGSLEVGLGMPLAFMLVFVASLIVMRLITDRVVPNNVSLGLYGDRAGGLVFGFFIGMILVGTALIEMQMLPIGSAILTFERFEVSKTTGRPVEKGFYFKPDAFSVGLASMLSGNDRFGAGNPLSVAKPGMLEDLYGARSAPQTEVKYEVPADAIKVMNYWDSPEIDHVAQKAPGGTLVREFSTQQADSGQKFLVCRIRLDPSKACDKQGSDQIRFRAAQFRLVEHYPNDASKAARLYLACGLSDVYTHRELNWKEVRQGQPARLVRFGPTTDFILSPGIAKAAGKVTQTGEAGNVQYTAEYYEIDVAFEVPADDPDLKPWYVEFRHGGRCELNEKMALKEPPEGFMQALQAHGGAASVQGGEIVKNEGVKVGDAPKGETHVANAVADRTGATTVLPIPLDRNDSQVVRSLRGGRLGECAIAVEVPDKLPEGPSAITELWAPEGKRVIQIGSEKCMPQSMFGKALNYAAKVATQVCVYSDDGTAYFAQGVYAYAPIGKNNWFEIQYYPEAEVPERCLKPMNKLTDSILKQTKESERRLGFIFVVPPGTKIVAFSAGKDRQSISGVQAPP